MLNNDGITHINIYSKGKTELGRFLSNFTHYPFITEDGKFDSVEGYWYWLLSNSPEKDVLKTLHGYKAKETGRKLCKNEWYDEEIFKSKIKTAILIKINSEDCYKSFIKNELPFDHYYVYGDKIVRPKEAQWIIDFFNEIRLKNAK